MMAIDAHLAFILKSRLISQTPPAQSGSIRIIGIMGTIDNDDVGLNPLQQGMR